MQSGIADESRAGSVFRGGTPDDETEMGLKGTPEVVFERVKAQLKARLGNEVYTNWFGSMKLADCSRSVIRLSVPTAFLKLWINGHYSDLIEELWKKGNPDILKVEIVVRSATRAVRPVVDEVVAALGRHFAQACLVLRAACPQFHLGGRAVQIGKPAFRQRHLDLLLVETGDAHHRLPGRHDLADLHRGRADGAGARCLQFRIFHLVGRERNGPFRLFEAGPRLVHRELPRIEGCLGDVAALEQRACPPCIGLGRRKAGAGRIQLGLPLFELQAVIHCFEACEHLACLDPVADVHQPRGNLAAHPEGLRHHGPRADGGGIGAVAY
jgi:hypothetical protein